MRGIRTVLTRRLYNLLPEREDNFYCWMAPMCDVEMAYDTTLSAFGPEEREPEHAG